MGGVFLWELCICELCLLFYSVSPNSYVSLHPATQYSPNKSCGHLAVPRLISCSQFPPHTASSWRGLQTPSCSASRHKPQYVCQTNRSAINKEIDRQSDGQMDTRLRWSVWMTLLLWSKGIGNRGAEMVEELWSKTLCTPCGTDCECVDLDLYKK
jgi:hypothetical protein